MKKAWKIIKIIVKVALVLAIAFGIFSLASRCSNRNSDGSGITGGFGGWLEGWDGLFDWFFGLWRHEKPQTHTEHIDEDEDGLCDVCGELMPFPPEGEGDRPAWVLRVEFIPSDGSESTVVAVRKGTAIGDKFPADPKGTPVKEGCPVFDGWYSDAGKFTKDTIVETDLTVVGRFSLLHHLYTRTGITENADAAGHEVWKYSCTRCGFDDEETRHIYQLDEEHPTDEQGRTRYVCSLCGADIVLGDPSDCDHEIVDGYCAKCGKFFVDDYPDAEPDDGHEHTDEDGDGLCDSCNGKMSDEGGDSGGGDHGGDGGDGGEGSGGGGGHEPDDGHKHIDEDGDGLCDLCDTKMPSSGDEETIPHAEHTDLDEDGLCDVGQESLLDFDQGFFDPLDFGGGLRGPSVVLSPYPKFMGGGAYAELRDGMVVYCANSWPGAEDYKISFRFDDAWFLEPENVTLDTFYEAGESYVSFDFRMNSMPFDLFAFDHVTMAAYGSASVSGFTFEVDPHDPEHLSGSFYVSDGFWNDIDQYLYIRVYTAPVDWRARLRVSEEAWQYDVEAQGYVVCSDYRFYDPDTEEYRIVPDGYYLFRIRTMQQVVFREMYWENAEGERQPAFFVSGADGEFFVAFRIAVLDRIRTDYESCSLVLVLEDGSESSDDYDPYAFRCFGVYVNDSYYEPDAELLKNVRFVVEATDYGTFVTMYFRFDVPVAGVRVEDDSVYASDISYDYTAGTGFGKIVFLFYGYYPEDQTDMIHIYITLAGDV